MFEQQAHPRDAAAEEICPRHAFDRPPLEMLPLDRRIEDDSTAVRDQTHAEIDVLDRRLGETELIEPAERDEELSADRPEASPESCRWTGTLLMNVVVKKVAKVGDHAVGCRIVVVGAKHRTEISVGFEGSPDANKRVRVDFDIRVDEDDDIAARTKGADIPGLTGAGGHRPIDDNELLRRFNAGLYGRDAARKRVWRVGCRDHDGQRHSDLLILRSE